VQDFLRSILAGTLTLRGAAYAICQNVDAPAMPQHFLIAGFKKCDEIFVVWALSARMCQRR